MADIAEAPNEGLIEALDEKTMSNLPDSVKGLLKHVVAAERQRFSQKQSRLDARQAELDKQREEIKKLNDEVIRNRADLNKVFLDPNLQELLKSADLKEEDMADPMSPEGMEQRMDKMVAERFKRFQEPITRSAQEAQQMAAYREFVSKNPKMEDMSFKTEVRDFMKAEREKGSSVTLDVAYAVVERNRLVQEQQRREESARRQRQEASRQVNRSSMSSQNTSSKPVPDWVMKDGYGGLRGNAARVKYLQDNPKALKALRAQQRRG